MCGCRASQRMLVLGELGSKEVAMISNVRQFLAAVPAVSIALLSHVGVCPACWPLIGGLMSSLGLAFLIESRYLLPLMVGCLVLAIAALGWGARRNYWPLILGVVASGAILIGKFALDASPVTVGGVGLLIGAYLWSFWLRRPSKASSCQSCCAPATTAAAEKSMAHETMTNPDSQHKTRATLRSRLSPSDFRKIFGSLKTSWKGEPDAQDLAFV